MDLTRLSITSEMLSLIAELDEFKGAWRALGVLAPERLNALRRVATIESIGSSTRIEGATLSDREIEKLLANIDVRALASRDEQEVAGYSDVMETIFANWRAIELTENHIKQLHRDLLKYSPKDERHRGAYKSMQNNIEAFDADGKSLGIVFKTSTPFDTPPQMAELVASCGQALDEKRHHPLLTIGAFIVTFLAIHPFQDGNGRLSRALTTLLLLRAGYGHVPYSSLENVIEKSKESYYLALRRTQASIWSDEPEWEPWVHYFLRALQRQKTNIEAKVRDERLLRERLPELSLRILEDVRDRGRTTVSEAVTLTGANRATVKKHLQALVASGQLTKQGAGRGTWYQLP
jgi:Fic family protein